MQGYIGNGFTDSGNNISHTNLPKVIPVGGKEAKKNQGFFGNGFGETNIGGYQQPGMKPIPVNPKSTNTRFVNNGFGQPNMK